jgi:predicted glycosyl hydrolase (DUF1957 family)
LLVYQESQHDAQSKNVKFWKKRMVWRKLENAAKYAAGLRVWRATGSDGAASQLPYDAKGTERYVTVYY